MAENPTNLILEQFRVLRDDIATVRAELDAFRAESGRGMSNLSGRMDALETEVTQRAIEELVQSADRDAINPHLMPDDALACYDSTVTDATQAASALSTIVGTKTLFK